MFYELVVWIHSYLRWVVLTLALVVVARSCIAWRQQRAWEETHERTHRALLGITNIQFLLGLALYVLLSPLPGAFLDNPRQAIKEPVLRFFGIEHITGMFLGIALLHIGRSRSRKAAGAARHRRVWTMTLAALVVVLASIPWPGRRYARPLLREVPKLAQAFEEPSVACAPVYGSRCAACHGDRGRGDGIIAASLNPRPRDFSDPVFMSQRSDEDIGAIIRRGGPALGLALTMPSHADLSEPEVQSLVRCVRSLGRAKD